MQHPVLAKLNTLVLIRLEFTPRQELHTFKLCADVFYVRIRLGVLASVCRMLVNLRGLLIQNESMCAFVIGRLVHGLFVACLYWLCVSRMCANVCLRVLYVCVCCLDMYMYMYCVYVWTARVYVLGCMCAYAREERMCTYVRECCPEGLYVFVHGIICKLTCVSAGVCVCRCVCLHMYICVCACICV